jgi:isoleucyl-tRNA synthetase
VLRKQQLGWPADLYVEAVDQHRGWFQVSLITAVATEGRAPYRSVLTHGLILDEAAKKMSKSQGNVVSPDDIISKNGADILRLLFTSVEFTADTCFSQHLLAPLLEAYRKIRNTCRFLLGNLYDFEPSKDAMRVEDLYELDRWILGRAQRLLLRSLEAYDAFTFHHVVQGLINFCAVDLSALYLDIVKDRLYCSEPAGTARRAAQTAIWKLLDLLTRLMAPILSYTAEDIWAHVPGKATRSVFEAGLPEPEPNLLDEALEAKWQRLLDVRAAATKALEEARKGGVIGHSLDARVRLAARDSLRPLLEEQKDSLSALFIVSQVELVNGLDDSPKSPIVPELTVSVEPARGAKCQRCWNFSEAVGTNAEHPGLCARCLEVVPKIQSSSVAG